MPGTVLVVEDNALLMMMYKSAIGEIGADLLHAKSGEDAVKMAHREPPDLVIMDIVLPGMSGITTARALRQLAGMQDVPIVAVTTQAELEETEALKEAGFVGTLTKPVNLDEFLQMIRGHLGGRQTT